MSQKHRKVQQIKRFQYFDFNKDIYLHNFTDCCMHFQVVHLYLGFRFGKICWHIQQFVKRNRFWACHFEQIIWDFCFSETFPFTNLVFGNIQSSFSWNFSATKIYLKKSLSYDSTFLRGRIIESDWQWMSTLFLINLVLLILIF